MLTNTEIQELTSLLKNKSRIVITSHTNPDGDAIGSSLAMYHYLLKLGNEVEMVVPNSFPDYYNWLPDSEKIVLYNKQSKYTQQLLNEADVVFSLDYNALGRLGALSEIMQKTKGKRILIDHHIDPEIESFDYCHSSVLTSSTGELVYDFISKMGDESLIDKKIGEAIYTGIVTDTGSFSFSCNRPETYDITAKLVKLGVDAQKIHKLIYDTFSENRLRLLGYSISHRMIVWEELHTAFIFLTKGDLKKYDYQVGDTEGVVNYPLSMDKINMSLLITEKEKQLRLSFRSKGDFSVNELSRKHFNGGGHRNAAGGKSNENIDEFIERLKSVLVEYKDELDYKMSL